MNSQSGMGICLEDRSKILTPKSRSVSGCGSPKWLAFRSWTWFNRLLPTDISTCQSGSRICAFFSLLVRKMFRGKNFHYQGEHCPPLVRVAVVSKQEEVHRLPWQLLVPEMPTKLSIKCLLIIHAVLKQMCTVLTNLCISHLLESGFHDFNGKMCQRINVCRFL